MTEKEIYRKAKKKVKAKKGFYAHFGSYAVGVLFFFSINYLTSPEFWWFIFPTLGWGMGVASHYFSVFGLPGMGGEDWEEKEMEKEMRKLERQHGYQTSDDDITVPDDELELKEFKKLRKEWDDQDLV